MAVFDKRLTEVYDRIDGKPILNESALIRFKTKPEGHDAINIVRRKIPENARADIGRMRNQWVKNALFSQTKYAEKLLNDSIGKLGRDARFYCDGLMDVIKRFAADKKANEDDGAQYVVWIAKR